jgi:hypothetical protein
MEPLERAAKAIAKRNYPGASEADIEEMWGGYVDDARTVLEAIREPSEGMLEPFGIHKARMKMNWKAMIDAILTP